MTKNESDKKNLDEKFSGVAIVAGVIPEGSNFRASLFLQMWEEGTLKKEDLMKGETAWGNKEGAEQEVRGLYIKAQEASIEHAKQEDLGAQMEVVYDRKDARK